MIPPVTLRWIERGLFGLGLLLAGLWLRDYRDAAAFQSVESHRLEAALRHADPRAALAPASAARATRRSPAPGDALGRIEIPRLRISAIIAEGTDPEVLERAVGHVASTPRPGGAGNAALAGHRDSFFRGLGGVHESDTIRIVTPEATYTYRVEWTAIVGPRSIDVLDSTATPSLTLVTCYPFRWVGTAPKRFVVRALRTDAGGSRSPAAGS